jgi:hypothetical protein
MENKSYKVVFSFEYERGNMSYSIVEPEMYGAMVQNKVDFEGFLFSRNNNMEIPLSVCIDLYLNPTTQVMEMSRFNGEKIMTEILIGQRVFAISRY